jgi:flagellar hook-length control protein FliK
MRVRSLGRLHRRAACAILQLKCYTHRVTDPASMPALSTLSLLSTAVSGLINVAGQVADALHNAKSGSSVCSHVEHGNGASSNQSQDASQLANVFAACLAAATASPTSPPRQQGIPSPTPPAKSAAFSQSARESALSLLPLSMMLAVGPTTALTAATALRSTMTGGNTASSPPTTTPSRVAGHAACMPDTLPACPTVQTAARTPGANARNLGANTIGPSLPSLVQGKAPTAPTAKQPAVAGAKMDLHSHREHGNKVLVANVGEQTLPAPGKGTPTTQRGGHPSSESPQPRGSTPVAQQVLPASGQKTTTEIPILALPDVPGPSLQDNPKSAAVFNASLSSERSASASSSNTHQPASASRSPMEAPSDSGVSQQGQVARSGSPLLFPSGSRTLFGNPPSHNSVSPLPSHAGEADAKPSFADSVSKQSLGTRNDSTRYESTSSLPVLPLVTADGSAGPLAGNTAAAASNHAPTNVPVAEQLSRALVAQAAIVNQAGRTDFHLRLEPPQLGSVQIHLTATNHNTVSARIVVSQEGTQQLIAGQAHQLRQSLAESGVMLGTFDVMHSGGGGFTQGGHHQPPEPPLPLTDVRSTSATTKQTHVPTLRVGTRLYVPTDGIDILA